MLMTTVGKQEGRCAELELDIGDIRVLVDIAFMTITHGSMNHSRAILDGLHILRPGSEAAAVGEGMCRLAMGQPDIAAEKLSDGPPTDAVRSFLGIALVQAGKGAEGFEVLKDVLQTSGGTPFGEVAAAVLRERAAIHAGNSSPFPAGAKPGTSRGNWPGGADTGLERAAWNGPFTRSREQ